MVPPARDVWVFGYGSLIYRPGFAYAACVDGYIKGYRRVFHQGSTDHRGTPQAPGRTVTLEPCDGAVTWGRAFRLAGTPEEQAATLQYLEEREKQYDARVWVDVFARASHDVPRVAGARTYLASADTARNPLYLGPAPLEQIALQIGTAAGPSGRNCEYLYNLADAMRQMGVEDPDLFDLERRVRAVCVLLKQQAEADST